MFEVIAKSSPILYRNQANHLRNQTITTSRYPFHYIFHTKFVRKCLQTISNVVHYHVIHALSQDDAMESAVARNKFEIFEQLEKHEHGHGHIHGHVHEHEHEHQRDRIDVDDKSKPFSIVVDHSNVEAGKTKFLLFLWLAHATFYS